MAEFNRDKLVELLKNIDVYSCDECQNCDCYKYGLECCDSCFSGKVADYLIANDVTVVKRGRWDDNHNCTACGKKALCEEKPDPYHPCHLLALFYVDSDFCPNCGADMREVDHADYHD